ncbi:MAG: hypothetical protein JWQ30_1022 [Sediminibacterium sp.]|nr:hypothetical protein [Sediminibacterium sp.]
MKKINRLLLTLVLCIISLHLLKAQTNQWTWINGDTAHNQLANYGVKGVAAATNSPGVRSDGVSWTDITGNLWLFGGKVKTPPNSSNNLNDLWKWDGTNWTWISGSNVFNERTIYGTKGVADPANRPGARTGSVGWTDNKGNLWLFGGSDGYNSWFNDLWKWDGINWTWINGGENTGSLVTVPPTINYHYGTKGVTDPANLPPGKQNSVTWVDSKGIVWVFGGIDYYYRGYITYSNDLWKWDGTNWTWVSGEYNYVAGNYGTKGIPAAANIPEPRYGSVSWVDDKDNLWLFGGTGQTSAALISSPAIGNFLNDLWKWDGSNWTWVNGSSTHDAKASYGVKGIAAASNTPGARKHGVGWADNSGHFWLFGGEGYGTGTMGYLNDLWKWDGTAWAWISGSNDIKDRGTYGTLGINAAANTPGARANSFRWRDISGNFCLYGGENDIPFSVPVVPNSAYNGYSELWKFNYGTGSGVVTAVKPPGITADPSSIILLNNPSAINQFSILSNKFYQKLNWQVLDINSRLLKEGVFKGVSKGSMASMQINNLPAGTYFIKLMGEDKVLQTKKWIKL